MRIPPVFRTFAAGLLAAACLAAAPSARADFDRTRWGMTVAEARAAYPRAVELSADLWKVDGEFRIVGRSFTQMGLGFENDRLTMILLRPVPEDMTGLMYDLTRTLGFGELMQVDVPGGHAFLFYFRDFEHDLSVTLLRPTPGSAAGHSLSLKPLGAGSVQDFDRKRLKNLCAATSVADVCATLR
jgi:hypothetical protein